MGACAQQRFKEMRVRAAEQQQLLTWCAATHMIHSAHALYDRHALQAFAGDKASVCCSHKRLSIHLGIGDQRVCMVVSF